MSLALNTLSRIDWVHPQKAVNRLEKKRGYGIKKDIRQRTEVRQMGGQSAMDLQAFYPSELKITGILEGNEEGAGSMFDRHRQTA